MLCKICKGHLADFAQIGKFGIQKCESCGFGQTNVTIEDLNGFYSQEYFAGDKAGFAQSDDEPIDDAKAIWVDKFVKGDNIDLLEIGPGPAAMIPRYLASTRKNVNVELIELSEYAAAKLSHAGYTVLNGHIYDDKILSSVSDRFDYLVATEVIEHELNPQLFSRGIFSALKEGGVACLSTGNFDGLMARMKGPRWYYIDPPAHVAYYTPKSIKILFSQAGFSKISVWKVGFKYLRMIKRVPVPGALSIIQLLGLPTGMTVIAQK